MSKLKSSIQNHWLLWLASVASFGVFVWLYLSSGSLEGGSDTYGHYLISRYAPKHEYLWLDQWGKPFFTLLSAPFTNIAGMPGLVFYNIMLAVVNGILAYAISGKLNLKYPIVAFLLTIFAPAFFNSIVSGLTEPTGAFVLLLFIYLYVNDKVFWASVVISFLPFVRSEGFIILFVVLVYYIVKKHYKYIGLLTAGSLLYSFAAFMVVDDVLWLFGSNPYLAQPDGVYGHGNFWHYIKLHETISGNPLTILWLGGVVLVVIKTVKAIKLRTDNDLTYFKFFVLIGAFAAFTFVHSYIWWKGSLGSAGFIRVFAAVLPLMVLIAMEAINWLANKITNKKVQTVTITLIALIITANNFIVSKLPYKTDPLNVEHEKVFKWIDDQGYVTNDEVKIFHIIPSMNVKLGLDPFNNKKVGNLNVYKHKAAKSGDIIVWDGLFSVTDARKTSDFFENNPDYKLLKHFDGNGEPMYEVKVFEKK